MKRPATLLAALLLTVPALTWAGSADAAATNRVFTTDDCGATISTNIYFRGDVDCTGTSQDAIQVGAPGLTINLSGYQLTVDDGYYGIDTDHYSGTTVTSGKIHVVGSATGIEHYYGSKLTVTKVAFQGDGGLSGGYGIYGDSVAALTVSGSTFDDLPYGIYANYSNVTVTGSTFSDNGDAIYTYYDSADKISSSNFYRNTDAAYYSEYTLLGAVSGSRFVDNQYGMYLYLVGYGSVNLSGNTITGSHYDGVYMYEGMDYLAKRSYITNNIFSDNDGDGLLVDYPGLMTIKGNIADSNGDDGIDVTNNYGYYGDVDASSNTARYNTDYGLRADYAATGSGNKAYGNYGTDCQNFVCSTTRK